MEKFKEYLKKNGLTYKMVAEVCGTSEHMVKKWCGNGKHKPNLIEASKLILLSFGELSIFDFLTEHENNNLFDIKNSGLNADFKPVEDKTIN